MTVVSICNLQCQKCGVGYRTENEFLARSSGWRMSRASELSFLCGCGQRMTLRRADIVSSPVPGKGDLGIFQAILHKRLPGISASARKIQVALQDHDVSNDQIAVMFKVEPLLAARVLFMAGAAHESFSIRRFHDAAKPPLATASPAAAALQSLQAHIPAQPIKSIAHAIAILGRKPLVNLLTIAELASLSFGKCRYGQREFLRDLLSLSSSADFLATKFPSTCYTPEHAYYSAALSVIGRAVQAICYPSLTDEILNIIDKAATPTSWEEAELMISGMQRSLALGEVAASVWDLSFEPAVFAEKRVSGASVPVPSTSLALSELLASAMSLAALASSGGRAASESLTEQVRSRLELGKDEWRAMALSVRGVVRAREASLAEFASPPGGTAA